MIKAAKLALATLKNRAEFLDDIGDDMYTQSAGARLINGAIVVLYWFALKDSANAMFLGAWAAALYLCILLLTVLWEARKRYRERISPARWLQLYMLNIFLYGLAWSLLFFTISDWSQLGDFAPPWLVIFAIMSAACASMGAHPPSYLLYTTPSVIVGTALLITRGGDDLQWLSVALLAYQALLFGFARKTNLSYLERLRLARENENLLDQVRGQVSEREDVIRQRTLELQQSNEELEAQAEKRATLEREARLQLELLNSVVDSTEDLIFYKDYSSVAGVYLGCNLAFAKSLGCTPEEVTGKTDADFFPAQAAEEMQRQDREVLRGGSTVTEQWTDSPDGRRVLFSTLKSPFRDEEDNIRGIVGVARDITSQKQAEATLRQQRQSLQHLAHHDTLTGLPNRLHLINTLEGMILNAASESASIALLFIDLDHFKDINDSLGHSIGDQVLRSVAERLRQCCRQGDVIARLGGDEFTVVLPKAGDQDEASQVAGKILQAFLQPLQLEDRQLILTPSIGISRYPHDGDSTEMLLRNADAAMYQAKRFGRNNFKYYSADLTDRASEKVMLENDLHLALSRDELFMHYQPQIDMRTGQMLGVEALMRWRHPTLGMVAPDEFIGIAEKSGAINRLGHWALNQVCESALAMTQAGMSGITFGVNVSARQLMDDRFYERTQEVVRKFANSTNGKNTLELELTESVLVLEPERIEKMMRKLRDYNVTMAIDDFGTGYSSLAYLKRYPISRLKIDSSFVRDIASDPNDRAISQTVIGLAHSLGMSVLAEGVESAQQREMLLEDGCNLGQGFLFSEALDVSSLLDYWRSTQPEPAHRLA